MSSTVAQKSTKTTAEASTSSAKKATVQRSAKIIAEALTSSGKKSAKNTPEALASSKKGTVQKSPPNTAEASTSSAKKSAKNTTEALSSSSKKGTVQKSPPNTAEVSTSSGKKSAKNTAGVLTSSSKKGTVQKSPPNTAETSTSSAKKSAKNTTEALASSTSKKGTVQKSPPNTAEASTSSAKKGTKRRMVGSVESVKKQKLNSGQGVTKREVKGKLQSKRKQMSQKKYFASKVVGRKRNLFDENGKRIVEYLVRWEGYGPEDDTWEECKADVFKKGAGKRLIPQFLTALRANASEVFTHKACPVILDFGDIPASLRNEEENMYVDVKKRGKAKKNMMSLKAWKKSQPSQPIVPKRLRKVDPNDPYPSAVCSQIAAEYAEIGKQREATKEAEMQAANKKAQKVASKIKTSKAQAVKTLQRKQAGTNKTASKTSKSASKKTKQSDKGKKPKHNSRLATQRPKNSQVKTSHSLDPTIVNSSSNDSDFLYSLTAASGDSNAQHRKRLFVNISQDTHSESSTGTPDTDPEISFKNSPRKRLLLKDSIRPKSDSSCHSIEVVTPATPASHPSPYRTPPSSPGGAGPSIQTPPLANRATTAMAEVIPSSPAAATYMKSIAASLQQKKKKTGGSDSGSSGERRVSLRQSEGVFKYKEIVVKKASGYTQILLYSQTTAKNALNPAVIEELKQVLHNARYDDTRVVLLSGSGNIFCSGVDLHYLTEGNRTQRAQKMADAVKDLVNVLIDFPKPIVVAVNGPAVGLGVAMLPLCDLVYASDKATFYCPYSRLGQTPEGASSFTFPTALGLATANDLLLAGRRLTATQAMQAGLVSQVFWPTVVMNEVVARVLKMCDEAAATPNALELSKMLIRGPTKAKLMVSNDSETTVLAGRWMAPDCQNLMRSYIDQEQHLYL